MSTAPGKEKMDSCTICREKCDDFLTKTEKGGSVSISEAEPIKAGNEKPITVCFVCTGNTCRSPMAAAALNFLGKGRYRAFSAGLAACEGDPISQFAVRALQSAGIQSSEENNYICHKATTVNPEMLERCDKVIAISKKHMLALIYSFPTEAEKISVMSEDIPDPFMCGEEVYKECLSKIISCLKEMFPL